MRAEISDYALLGDTQTTALVSRDGRAQPWPSAPEPPNSGRLADSFVIPR